ncbi:MAG: PHP domain-containing protein [Chloroflexi bacterium]|nr:PHP domain-containing protein [Chloroflexota bacterium]
MPVTNDQIAGVFLDMAALLELKGDIVFKIRAYQRAARVIEQYPEALERLDLKDVHAMRARDLGVNLVIDTDSHTAAFLGMIRFGVAVARRG